jgi:hypothetical protein
MVVEVGEHLPVHSELFVQPGALFRGQVFEHLGGAIPVNLAHGSRISLRRWTIEASRHSALDPDIGRSLTA